MNYAEIEILREIVQDELNVTTRSAVVDKVTDNYINARIGHATILKRLPVIGNIAYLEAGSTVLVLTVAGTHYALSSGVFSGSGSRDGGSYYSLGSLYYDKTEVDDLLGRKADAGHSHRYDHLEAITGTVGGFEVGVDYIRSSAGNFAIISNPGATRMVMGSNDDVAVMDGAHATYRFWAGKADPTTAPFSVTKAGAIKATSGQIAGWDITATELSKNNVEIDPLGKIVISPGDTSEDYAVFGRVKIDDSATNWRLWIGHSDPALAPFRVDKNGNATLESATISLTLESDNFETGVRGWKLWNTGEAEFQDVIVRGRIEASVFAETTISGVSGQMLISIGDVLLNDVEATDTTIDVVAGVFGANDIIHFRPSGKEEWMRVTTQPTAISGGFQYGVERAYDGGSSQAFEAGTAMMVKGSAGAGARTPQGLAAGAAEGAFGALQPGGGGGGSSGGWIVLDGASSALSVITRQGPVWNQFATTVRIGNLSGFLDYSSEIYGLAIGDENDFMSYDETNGLRIQFVGSAYDTTISGSGFDTELILLSEIAAPPTGTPPANKAAIFLDQSDNTVKFKLDTGDIVALANLWSRVTGGEENYVKPYTTGDSILLGTATEHIIQSLGYSINTYRDQSVNYGYGSVWEVENGNSLQLAISEGNNAGWGGFYLARHQRGSRGSPSPVNSGDRLGGFLVGAYAATATWSDQGGLIGYAAENWSSTNRGTYVELTATPTGSTTRTTIGRLYGDKLQLLKFLEMAEVAAPSTPASGYTAIYPKTDGLLYFKNDAGDEYELTNQPPDMIQIQVFT